jgi:hypothetical protein
LAFCADLGNKLFWGRNATVDAGTPNWNGTGANPASGTGGYSFTATAPFYIYCDVESDAVSGIYTAKFAAPFTGAVPSGFSAW